MLFNTSILDPNVCAIPVCLKTLMILLVLNKFKTFKVSEPILRDPPIATVFGISVTKISSILPLTFPSVMVFPKPVVSVAIPTLNDPVKLTIDVLKSEIEIDS